MGVSSQHQAPAGFTHCTGGRVGTRAGLDGCRKSRPHQISMILLNQKNICKSGWFLNWEFFVHSYLQFIFWTNCLIEANDFTHICCWYWYRVELVQKEEKPCSLHATLHYQHAEVRTYVHTYIHTYIQWTYKCGKETTGYGTSYKYTNIYTVITV